MMTFLGFLFAVIVSTVALDSLLSLLVSSSSYGTTNKKRLKPVSGTWRRHGRR